MQFQVYKTKHMQETTGKRLGSWWVQKKCGLLKMLDVINVIGVYFSPVKFQRCYSDCLSCFDMTQGLHSCSVCELVFYGRTKES